MVRSALVDKHAVRTPRSRVALVAALTAAITLLGSQMAFAQSGGTGPPGGTTTTDPTTTTSPAPSGQTFPVAGAHTFGDGFGAARSGHTHQGQDIMAACGTPLVAARGGVVKANKYHPAAGNYLVINGDHTGIDYGYMHLRA